LRSRSAHSAFSQRLGATLVLSAITAVRPKISLSQSIGAAMNSINHQFKRSAAAVGASAIFGLGAVGAVMAPNFDSEVNATDVTVKGEPRPTPEPAQLEFGTQAIVMGVPALTGRPGPWPGQNPNRIPE
jgi:hypothetical protein